MMLRTHPCHHSSTMYSSSHISCRALHSSSATPGHPAYQQHGYSLTAVGMFQEYLTRWQSSWLPEQQLQQQQQQIGQISRSHLQGLPTPAHVGAPDPPSPKAAGGDLARMVTKKVSSCGRLVDLSDIYDEWGGSFDYIHAAAAIRKYAQLSNSRSVDTKLLQQLLRCWQKQLPDAGEQACANVLWALGSLGKSINEVWVPTFEAYMDILQQEMQTGGVPAQSVTNVLWACAKLRKQPTSGKLGLLMQAALLPQVLDAADPQALSNSIWALGRLSQQKGWTGGVDEEVVQQLLGEQQLQLLSAGKPQEISNALLGLTLMATSATAVISNSFTVHCSKQLLADTAPRLLASKTQHVCNSLWACGELGLADTPFLAAAGAAAGHSVADITDQGLVQVATACDKLHFKHQGLVAAMLQRAQQLIQHAQVSRSGRKHGPSGSLVMGPVEIDRMLGRLCAAVADLNMQQLAPQAVQLVATSGIGQRRNTHPSNIRRLWVFHIWLLQHQLLDGKGLAGVLSQQQLQQGQHDAGVYVNLV